MVTQEATGWGLGNQGGGQGVVVETVKRGFVEMKRSKDTFSRLHSLSKQLQSNRAHFTEAT